MSTMPDGHPQLVMMLNQLQFLGPTEVLQKNMKPLPMQYGIKPGDKCLMATGNTMVESDFTVVSVIEPDSHPDLFPDWPVRVEGVEGESGPHVLGEWFSTSTPEGDLGWFSRMKLIPIAEEHYAAVQGWRDASIFPEERVGWIEDAYSSYTDQFSQLDSGIFPTLVTCGACGSRNVELHIVGKKIVTARAGQLQRKGKTVYVPVNDPVVDYAWLSHLICQNEDCKATKALEEEDWDLPE